MRLGIFGGTFDPPHLAHLILASEARAQLALARVLWVLTPFPPHKTGQMVTPLDLRLEMLGAALADDPCFELSRVDIDRPAPHYAVDTLRLLRQQYPRAELVYLMGGDSLNNLPSWHAPRAFVESCDALGVMQRPGAQIDWDALETSLPRLHEKVRFFCAPEMEIASGLIRQKIAAGQPFRYYLPEAVYAVIVRRGLYRTAASTADPG